MGRKKSSVPQEYSGKQERFTVKMFLICFAVICLVAAFLFFWISGGLGRFIDGISSTLGWGIVLVLLAIIVILCILFRKRLDPIARKTTLIYWYRWLGAVVLVFFVWGILGWLSWGGSVGRSIFGSNAFLGVFRLLFLFLLAYTLLLPAIAWRSAKLFARLVKGLTSRIGRKKTVDSNIGEKPATSSKKPKAIETSSSEKEFVVQSGKTVVPATLPIHEKVNSKEKKSSSSAHSDQPANKQIALDIWQKYGNSPNVLEIDGWKLPPIDLLDSSPELELNDADNHKKAKLIEDALNSYGVAGKVTEINVGPTVTQFGIEPGWDIRTKRIHEKDRDGKVTYREEEISRTRVKVERITALANNLALALSASTIRIEAPVPGKPVVGVEVPNNSFSTVSLRAIIEANNFQKLLTKTKLAIALGKGAGGEAIADNLAKMPHLLIAGSTGSGKTVCLNAIICCILMCNTPYDVKLILIDPKRVEMTQFNSMPHLAAPVIVDTDKALSTMRWLNQEMDNRYKKLQAVGARNIEGYNKDRTGSDRMHYLVLVIDELADLMMAGFDEVETILCRLAQLARAVGIHLIVATQRPSVDVITGLIKANFPTRISFAVTSQVDSRTILDAVGAEKLLGRGDMLYAPPDAVKPKRLQGCYVSDNEVERIVYFWNSQRKDDVTPLSVAEIASAPPLAKKDVPSEDPLMNSVRDLANEHDQMSASFLQRKLGIGYPRAAKLYDQLKEETAKPGDDGGAEIPKEDW